ncbi:MAG TPA: hypothetical protein VFN60_07885 [Acidimicrobiales bacterium]|nr:hypothetical protein [Acidimicrobiales bacterium]
MKRIILACCGLVLVAATGGCGGPSHHQTAGAGFAGSGTSTSSVQAARSSGTTGGRRSSTGSSTGAPSTSTSTSTSTAPSTTAAGGSDGSGGAGSSGGAGGAGAGAGGTGAGTSVVPPVITVAYVDGVFAKLDAVAGDALRSSKAADRVTQQAVQNLYAVFDESIVGPQLKGLGLTVQSHFANIRPNPGNESTNVVRLLHRSASCIFATVRTNFTQVTDKSPRPPVVQYEGLRRVTALNRREGDPTPWEIFYSVEYFKPYVPGDPCQ